jgi:outer membrane protein
MKFNILIIPLIIINQMSAQQNVQPLRLTDCIAQALGQNPSIQISEAKVQAAEARSSEAMTGLLPQLKLSGRAAKLSEVDPYSISIQTPLFSFSKEIFPSITENYSLKLTLQQPLFTGFKLLKSREMAALNADAMHEDLTRDQCELVLNVKTSYWNLFRAYKIEEVIRQSVEQMSEHLKDVKNLARQGLATDADVMKVQVQCSDVKVKHIEARNAIHLASMALNSILGNSLDLSVMPADTPEVFQGSDMTALQDDLQLLQKRARDRRPELKSMLLRRDRSSAGVDAARGGWYPQIFLNANYDYSKPNQRIIPPKFQWNGTWDVGVSLQWNIWDWLATHYQTVQAQADLRQTEAGMVQLIDAVTLDVAQQYFNTQTAKEKVEVTYEGAQQAQESYRMTSEKYKNGLTSNTEMLDAEISLLQAKLTHTQAVVDCTLALARLKRAVGDSE